MNQANVDALTTLIREINDAHYYDGPVAADDMARALAARGVLVPSALTPSELNKIGDVIEREMAGSGADDPEAAAASREMLERIASGEQSPSQIDYTQAAADLVDGIERDLAEGP